MKRLLLIAALAVSAQANAAIVNIPWSVDLLVNKANLPLSQQSVQEFQGLHTVSGGVTVDDYYVTAGLDFTANTTHEYRIRLPFNISISAPDQVSPGQKLRFETSVQLAGTPYFGLNSSLDFGTGAFVAYNLPAVGEDRIDIGLPDEMSIGPATFTLGGDRSAASATTSYREISAGTPWRVDSNGQPLEILDGTARFLGYGLTTTNEMDAWGAGVDLLDLLGLPLPGVEVPLGMGMDVLDRVDLQTNFVTAFYIDNMGGGYDNILLNQISGGYVPFTVPSTLSAGDTYSMQFSALGLGFNTVYDMLFQTEFRLGIDLDLGFCCDPWTILSADVGDPWLVDRFINSYQYIQFINEFTAQTYQLSFSVVDGLGDVVPPLEPPAIENASINQLLADAIESGDGRMRYDLAGNAPGGASVTHAVPEPSVLGLVGFGIVGLVIGRRRKLH